jgi:hypothetical protein
MFSPRSADAVKGNPMSNLRLLFAKPKRNDTLVVEKLQRFLQFIADSLNEGVLKHEQDVDPAEFLRTALEIFLNLESEKEERDE